MEDTRTLTIQLQITTKDVSAFVAELIEDGTVEDMIEDGSLYSDEADQRTLTIRLWDALDSDLYTRYVQENSWCSPEDPEEFLRYAFDQGCLAAG